MQIRVPTKESLIYDVAAGAVSTVALSAALLSPPAFGKPLTLIALIALVVLTPISIARQRRGTANFALVSASERRAYLIRDTALVFSMLASVAAVFFLIYTSYPTPIRAGLGHLALLLAAVTHATRVRLTMNHAARVSPTA